MATDPLGSPYRVLRRLSLDQLQRINPSLAVPQSSRHCPLAQALGRRVLDWDDAAVAIGLPGSEWQEANDFIKAWDSFGMHPADLAEAVAAAIREKLDETTGVLRVH